MWFDLLALHGCTVLVLAKLWCLHKILIRKFVKIQSCIFRDTCTENKTSPVSTIYQLIIESSHFMCNNSYDKIFFFIVETFDKVFCPNSSPKLVNPPVFVIFIWEYTQQTAQSCNKMLTISTSFSFCSFM